MLTLVDTSALVEFDRATGTAVHLRVRELLASRSPVATTEPVLGEVLSGAVDAQSEPRLRRMFGHFRLLPCLARIDFDAAAGIYRACRAAGVEPGGLMDCVIASVAMRHGASILAADLGFARMAAVVPLVLDPACPSPRGQ